jgi:hypothetical protein
MGARGLRESPPLPPGPTGRGPHVPFPLFPHFPFSIIPYPPEAVDCAQLCRRRRARQPSAGVGHQRNKTNTAPVGAGRPVARRSGAAFSMIPRKPALLSRACSTLWHDRGGFTRSSSALLANLPGLRCPVPAPPGPVSRTPLVSETLNPVPCLLNGAWRSHSTWVRQRWSLPRLSNHINF